MFVVHKIRLRCKIAFWQCPAYVFVIGNIIQSITSFVCVCFFSFNFIFSWKNITYCENYRYELGYLSGDNFGNKQMCDIAPRFHLEKRFWLVFLKLESIEIGWRNRKDWIQWRLDNVQTQYVGTYFQFFGPVEMVHYEANWGNGIFLQIIFTLLLDTCLILSLCSE